MPLVLIGHRGASDGNATYTNGGAPGAITPHSSTQNGDLLVWVVHIRGTGGNESCAWPGGWSEVFQSSTTSGTLAVATRTRTAGDTSYTLGALTNVTSGTTGETVTTTILTFRGHHPSSPLGSYTASLSTWATSTNMGAVSEPSSTSLPVGSWVLVIAFKHENITATTTLSGDNLTWSQVADGANNYFNTTSGADSGGNIQIGKNLTSSAQTITAKTITASGTTQVGCGRMLVLNPAPAKSRGMGVIG